MLLEDNPYLVSSTGLSIAETLLALSLMSLLLVILIFLLFATLLALLLTLLVLSPEPNTISIIRLRLSVCALLTLMFLLRLLS
jgi:hypothetical protein